MISCTSAEPVSWRYFFPHIIIQIAKKGRTANGKQFSKSFGWLWQGKSILILPALLNNNITPLFFSFCPHLLLSHKRDLSLFRNKHCFPIEENPNHTLKEIPPPNPTVWNLAQELVLYLIMPKKLRHLEFITLVLSFSKHGWPTACLTWNHASVPFRWERWWQCSTYFIVTWRTFEGGQRHIAVFLTLPKIRAIKIQGLFVVQPSFRIKAFPSLLTHFNEALQIKMFWSQRLRITLDFLVKSHSVQS